MSAGSMSQSVALPREMLEALGQYKDALKDVKSELKDLEKEAKAIEKKGGIVPDSMQQQLTGLRGERNRLESVMSQQKQDKANARRFQQKRGNLRRAFYNPVGAVLDVGMRRLEKTQLYDKLSKFADRAYARAGEALNRQVIGQQFFGGATVGGLAGAGALGLGGGAAAIGIAIERDKMRQRGVEGTAETDVFLGGVARSAAFGGSTAQDFQRTIVEARQAGAQARRTLDSASAITYAKSIIFGGTTAGQDIDDKVIQQRVRRAQKRNQYGSGYGDAIDLDNIKKKRRTQYRAEMLKELGYINAAVNTAAEVLTGTQNTSYYDVAGGIYSLLGLTSEVKAAEVIVNERMKEMVSQKWEKDIESERTLWNDTIATAKAIQRADAHERNNALQAYQSDLLTRGLTWSLQ